MADDPEKPCKQQRSEGGVKTVEFDPKAVADIFIWPAINQFLDQARAAGLSKAEVEAALNKLLPVLAEYAQAQCDRIRREVLLDRAVPPTSSKN
jgi:hypothetical protein